MSQEEEEEVIVQKTENFTERFVTDTIISHTPDGNFILDFGRPALEAYARKENGKVIGHKGSLQLDVRLFMNLKNVKGLLEALKSNIERYEGKSGKINVSEEENDVSSE